MREALHSLILEDRQLRLRQLELAHAERAAEVALQHPPGPQLVVVAQPLVHAHALLEHPRLDLEQDGVEVALGLALGQLGLLVGAAQLLEALHVHGLHRLLRLQLLQEVQVVEARVVDVLGLERQHLVLSQQQLHHRHALTELRPSHVPVVVPEMHKVFTHFSRNE